MGTPAVVYPVPGLIESTLDGVTGRVSGTQTPEALAATIQRALAEPDKYQVHRTSAWNRAKTFHWDKVLPEACDWLERQAGGERDIASAHAARTE
jgi:glycosyltransferase involved in cell wall biosynthesis